MGFTLRFHAEELAVCQLDIATPVPVHILEAPFSAFLRTPGEATLICPVPMIPQGAKSEVGWIALELVGPFDFSLTGILTQINVPLSQAEIPIYVLSTFNTDYVLIKADNRKKAQAVLTKAGHTFIE